MGRTSLMSLRVDFSVTHRRRARWTRIRWTAGERADTVLFIRMMIRIRLRTRRTGEGGRSSTYCTCMSCCELVFVKNHLSVCAYTLSVLFILAIIYLLGLSGCLGVGGPGWAAALLYIHLLDTISRTFTTYNKMYKNYFLE